MYLCRIFSQNQSSEGVGTPLPLTKVNKIFFAFLDKLEHLRMKKCLLTLYPFDF